MDSTEGASGAPQTEDGSWMASDGQWYPAHLHADPAHRAKFATEEATAMPEATATSEEPAQPEHVARAAAGDGAPILDEPETLDETSALAETDGVQIETSTQADATSQTEQAEPDVEASTAESAGAPLAQRVATTFEPALATEIDALTPSDEVPSTDEMTATDGASATNGASEAEAPPLLARRDAVPVEPDRDHNPFVGRPSAEADEAQDPFDPVTTSETPLLAQRTPAREEATLAPGLGATDAGLAQRTSHVDHSSADHSSADHSSADHRADQVNDQVVDWDPFAPKPDAAETSVGLPSRTQAPVAAAVGSMNSSMDAFGADTMLHTRVESEASAETWSMTPDDSVPLASRSATPGLDFGGSSTSTATGGHDTAPSGHDTAPSGHSTAPSGHGTATTAPMSNSWDTSNITPGTPDESRDPFAESDQPVTAAAASNGLLPHLDGNESAPSTPTGDVLPFSPSPAEIDSSPLGHEAQGFGGGDLPGGEPGEHGTTEHSTTEHGITEHGLGAIGQDAWHTDQGDDDEKEPINKARVAIVAVPVLLLVLAAAFLVPRLLSGGETAPAAENELIAPLETSEAGSNSGEPDADPAGADRNGDSPAGDSPASDDGLSAIDAEG